MCITDFLRLRTMTSAALIACALLAANAILAAPAPARPNVVFIMADDLGYGDLGCYGAPDIRTPNIDRLAAQGVRLTDYYANAPVCTPTRCAFMTGRYQQRIGGMEWAIYPGITTTGLPGAETTLAEMLRDAGYATAMSGKWHLGYKPEHQPNAQGFDRFFGLLSGNHDYFHHRERMGMADLYLDEKPIEMRGYSTELITRHALDFLRQIEARPFFLYVAYNAPHFPYQTPDDADAPDGYLLPASRERYVKMVEALDAGVGQLLAALDREPLRANTLVIFTSDNGGDIHARNLPLAKTKGTLWEGGIRVPCLARLPGRIAAGSVSSQVAITMDWSATLLQLAGAKPPRDRPLDGIDLLPLLTGQTPPVERTLFWRRVDQREIKTHRAVRSGNWKYIDEPGGARYLYDLARDIGESRDLAAEQPARVEELKTKLDTWETSIAPSLYSQSGRQVPVRKQ